MTRRLAVAALLLLALLPFGAGAARAQAAWDARLDIGAYPSQIGRASCRERV